MNSDQIGENDVYKGLRRLSTQHYSATQIAGKLGYTRPTPRLTSKIGSILSDLEEQGRVIRKGRGKWSLA